MSTSFFLPVRERAPCIQQHTRLGQKSLCEKLTTKSLRKTSSEICEKSSTNLAFSPHPISRFYFRSASKITARSKVTATLEHAQLWQLSPAPSTSSPSPISTPLSPSRAQPNGRGMIRSTVKLFADLSGSLGSSRVNGEQGSLREGNSLPLCMILSRSTRR